MENMITDVRVYRVNPIFLQINSVLNAVMYETQVCSF